MKLEILKNENYFLEINFEEAIIMKKKLSKLIEQAKDSTCEFPLTTKFYLRNRNFTSEFNIKLVK